MSTCVALPGDEFFSEGYMDAFYKAHVASTRTRGLGTLDDDIAAIEAEIRKVQQYRSKFQSYRLDSQHLNSCGNSECSDEDEQESRQDLSPTSVFKVYNSSGGAGDPVSPYLQQKSPDVFTWATAQQVQHDHSYCQGETSLESHQTIIDHGTVAVSNVQWSQLSCGKRAHVVQKLSCILQQRPSGRQSPTFSSLDLLPTSLVNWIRKTSSLVECKEKTEDSEPSLPRTTPCVKTTSQICSKVHIRKVGIKEVQQRVDCRQQSGGVAVSGRGGGGKAGHKRKTSPYNMLTRPVHVEVTRVRNVSSCSEGDDPVVID